jgi:hypothetical protein
MASLADPLGDGCQISAAHTDDSHRTERERSKPSAAYFD